MNKSESFQSVIPVSPAAPYIGGKRILAKKISEIIATIPHTTYCEPFVGMGGVFFRRDTAARSEVINDYSKDVATFFRVLQRHYVPFLEMFRFQLTTRADFERLMKTDPDTLTDLERSARFLFLQRTSFGGKVRCRTFGVSYGRSSSFDVTRLGPVLDAIHDRLSGVLVECLPWEDFVQRYDRAGTLFYLDPPYFGNERDYGDGMFSRDQFERMAEVLGAIKGRFILSINDRPEVRRIFAAFKMEPVRLKYTVGGGGKAKDVGELIITNG